VREFLIGGRGIELVDVFAQGNQVLTGFARERAQARQHDGAAAARKE
jgi:hypothetical protein